MQLSSKQHWDILRKIRNKLLVETDHTQLADFPIDSKNRTLYREYRQYLRDLPRLYDNATIEKAKVKTFSQWKEWRKGGDY
jgi:hypothetical protein